MPSKHPFSAIFHHLSPHGTAPTCPIPKAATILVSTMNITPPVSISALQTSNPVDTRCSRKSLLPPTPTSADPTPPQPVLHRLFVCSSDAPTHHLSTHIVSALNLTPISAASPIHVSSCQPAIPSFSPLDTTRHHPVISDPKSRNDSR
jgi:hypothetical protein